MSPIDNIEKDEYGEHESVDDDPWAGYPGPGPGEEVEEPPF